MCSAISLEYWLLYPGLDITTHLVSEETARNVDFLTPHNYDFLAGQNLLRDNGGQSTKEMTLAINDDGCRREGGHCRDLARQNDQFFLGKTGSRLSTDLGKAKKRCNLALTQSYV